MSAVNEAAAGDAILTCDSGTIATWAARHWIIRGDRQFYLSGNLATMAPGLPYAIGIQHAFPGRQVIAFVGDGGFAMLMAEFITAIKHKLPVKVVINNNNSLGQILWEQMILGYPEYGVRHPEPFVDYAALATGNGAFGVKVARPGGAAGRAAGGVQSRRARAGRRQRQPRGAAAAGQGRVRRRRRSSPRRSCTASRTRRRSPPPCSRTRSSSCARDKPAGPAAKPLPPAAGPAPYSARQLFSRGPGRRSRRTWRCRTRGCRGRTARGRGLSS